MATGFVVFSSKSDLAAITGTIFRMLPKSRILSALLVGLGVALMAGGWEGAHGPHPGFPDDGRWVVRSEGIGKLP